MCWNLHKQQQNRSWTLHFWGFSHQNNTKIWSFTAHNLLSEDSEGQKGAIWLLQTFCFSVNPLVFRSLKWRQKLWCHSVVWGEIFTSDRLFAAYEFRTSETQFQASHSLQSAHTTECSYVSMLNLYANIHGSQLEETREFLFRVQKNLNCHTVISIKIVVLLVW